MGKGKQEGRKERREAEDQRQGVEEPRVESSVELNSESPDADAHTLWHGLRPRLGQDSNLLFRVIARRVAIHLRRPFGVPSRMTAYADVSDKRNILGFCDQE